MTEFTPGPWLLEKGFYGWWSAVAASTGFEIARVESGEANARLVAAAPDLYQALQDCLAALTGEQVSPSWTIGACGRAKIALRKARGEI